MLLPIVLDIVSPVICHWLMISGDVVTTVKAYLADVIAMWWCCYHCYRLFGWWYQLIIIHGISCSLVLNENLIVGCILLAMCLKSSSACLPWPHIMKMSSMNLSHILGFLGEVSISWISTYFMNIFAYEGAILVPIAVPCICLYSLLLKLK